MNETRLLFFGPLREAAGGGERLVQLPDEVATPAGVIDWISAGDEVLAARLAQPDIRIAVDQKIVDRDASFDGAEEIAFLPPFSGG
ncbi:MAG: MoaD/ThiS family protein [Pseudomonadota bacterium]